MKLLKAISSPIIGKFYCCFSSISHKTSAIQLIRRDFCVQRKSNLINYRSKICYSSRKIRMKKINNNFARLSSERERANDFYDWVDHFVLSYFHLCWGKWTNLPGRVDTHCCRIDEIKYLLFPFLPFTVIVLSDLFDEQQFTAAL